MHALQQTQYRQIQKILREEERQKIRLLRRIPNYDYTVGLRQAQTIRCEGTCQWLLNKPEFRGWLDRKDSKHFWCYGIPGCGKTILAGYAIDYLKTTFPATDDTVVIYYFFDYSNPISLRMSTFLRCILHQVIRLDSLLPNFQRRLESLFIGPIDAAEPYSRDLTDIFIELYRKFKNAFLIIDGLDEMDKNEQRNVIHFLKEVQIVNNARILVFTHPNVDMSKVLGTSSTLQITPHDVQQDIDTFIQRQMKENSKELSVCSPSELGIIKQVLLSGAEAM
ncbi:hypothetical protein GQ43DRAFT_477831 [Delitschia confertaspora ATCC 74209]|uniref:Nephrocystin 3-like N-terminal domain-containing protein n=1 Tax=Delitschia confertaspora ATCC 74209 TaxID=1513339 RepID=A0A9P4JXA1_9PLEO|nr:hypothetical protein GQ43DRAFT_477831 [Delitschia confertaspora ATCC 74209]